MAPTPMFPLGSVLLPGIAMPLRIFEPRYRQMLGDVLSASGTFGVVLIERGSEVGGGDVRFDVGTLARIVRHEPNADGSHAILIGGERRIRVERWLTDDPYPRAEIVEFPDPPLVDPVASATRHADAIRDVRRFLAQAVEAGLTVPPATFEVAGEPVADSYILAALAPLGPLDRQRLLESVDADTRLDLLVSMLEDRSTTFE